MTRSARFQALADILGALYHTSQPIDHYLRGWARMHRFAGSNDDAVISENVYAILRHRSSLAWRMGCDDLRALAIALQLMDGQPVKPLFGTS